MNSIVPILYLLTSQNDEYRNLIVKKQLPGLLLTEHRQEATLLLADPPLAAPVMAEFPSLHWLQSTFAGIDALVQPHLPRNYYLTNIKGIFGASIAEYVLGHLMAYVRHFDFYRKKQDACVWEPRTYENIIGKTMVILGTGSIASHLARAAHNMGLNVIGVNRSGGTPEDSCFSHVYPLADLESAFSVAHVIVSTLPNTAESTGLLNFRTLGYCHQALLFNVGRGQTLKEHDLIPAIEAGAIQHAFLDVFDKEPLDSTHPFWRHDRITVTPHIAALSFPEQIVDIFAENFIRWSSGKPLNHLIDFDRGY